MRDVYRCAAGRAKLYGLDMQAEATGAGAARGRCRRSVGETDDDDVASVGRQLTTHSSSSCHMSQRESVDECGG